VVAQITFSKAISMASLTGV